MDPTAFDRLTRIISASASRRGALVALLGALGTPLAQSMVAARRRKTKGKNDRDEAKAKAKRKRKGKSRTKTRAARQRTPDAQTEAASCCKSGACAPGKGKNLAKCCYQNQDLTGKNFQGANLSSANFSGATLTGANLQGANAGKTCLVDADLRGARINNTTNLSGAIYCRTKTDNGENNAGCDQGTPCCPTCDAANPCGDDEVCCTGKCVKGQCCGTDPSTCAFDPPLGPCERAVCSSRRCLRLPRADGFDCGDDPDRICCSGICCQAGAQCSNGECLGCDRTCPDGCCDANGVCQTQSDARCGRGGVTCTNCNDRDTTCANFTCDASTGACIAAAINPGGVCTTETGRDGVCCNGTCTPGECCPGAACDNGTGNCCPVNGVNACLVDDPANCTACGAVCPETAPPLSPDCATPRCDNRECSFALASSGTECTLSGPGGEDGVCNGMGRCVACLTSADCSTAGTGNLCCDGQCETGECCPNADPNGCPAEEPVCNASFECVCVEAGTCPPPTAICTVATCANGACGADPAPDNTDPGDHCGDAICCNGACCPAPSILSNPPYVCQSGPGDLPTRCCLPPSTLQRRSICTHDGECCSNNCFPFSTTHGDCQ